jgi:hypothetical protein
MSEKRHPGYVLGNHWLQTAYERICAGEAEADVLADYGVTRTNQPDDWPTNDADLAAVAEMYATAFPGAKADQPAAAPSGFDVSASARFKSKSEQRRYAYQTGGCVYCLKEPCECNTDQQSGCPACGNGCYSPERGCADGKCRMYKAPSQQSSALTQGEQDTFWNALLHQGPPDKPSGA